MSVQAAARTGILWLQSLPFWLLPCRFFEVSLTFSFNVVCITMPCAITAILPDDLWRKNDVILLLGTNAEFSNDFIIG